MQRFLCFSQSSNQLFKWIYMCISLFCWHNLFLTFNTGVEQNVVHTVQYLGRLEIDDMLHLHLWKKRHKLSLAYTSQILGHTGVASDFFPALHVFRNLKRSLEWDKVKKNGRRSYLSNGSLQILFSFVPIAIVTSNIFSIMHKLRH